MHEFKGNYILTFLFLFLFEEIRSHFFEFLNNLKKFIFYF